VGEEGAQGGAWEGRVHRGCVGWEGGMQGAWERGGSANESSESNYMTILEIRSNHHNRKEIF
jgi:hypothetical protein